MKQTTGQIIGKAHRLCEWMRREDAQIYPNISTVPMSWAVDAATKWHVGNADDLPGDMDRNEIDPLIKLPCKQMLIEADCRIRMADGRVEQATSFALCYDNAGDEPGIDCFFFAHVAGRFLSYGGGRICRSENGISGWKNYSSHGICHEDNLDVKSGVAIVERALVALSCTNIRSVENQPPAALNKKRKKQGKAPLFTYKTLHILSGARGASHDPCADDDEARRSPRLHFRRGHVRRLCDARITWVQQCMVGNKALGRVEKAYAIDHRKPIQ